VWEKSICFSRSAVWGHRRRDEVDCALLQLRDAGWPRSPVFRSDILTFSLSASARQKSMSYPTRPRASRRRHRPNGGSESFTPTGEDALSSSRRASVSADAPSPLSSRTPVSTCPLLPAAPSSSSSSCCLVSLPSGGSVHGGKATCFRNCCARGVRRVCEKKSSGPRVLQDRTLVQKDHPARHLARENPSRGSPPIMVMPVPARVRASPPAPRRSSRGSSADVGSSNSMIFGFHGQRARAMGQPAAAGRPTAATGRRPRFF